MDGKSASQGSFCRHCNAWRGSLGLEPTPSAYVEHMVEVFRDVRRVLHRDGTLWLNIGDSCNSGAQYNHGRSTGLGRANRYSEADDKRWGGTRPLIKGFKPKDLLGIPWALAFALRDDGWYLRSEITWAKRAPMPESVTDRPTSATEKVFLLSKSARYFYDSEAVKEPDLGTDHSRSVVAPVNRSQGYLSDDTGIRTADGRNGSGRNMRNWWLLGPEPFAEAHFATFPAEIPRRAILAGTSARGVCPKCGAPWGRITETHRAKDPTRHTGRAAVGCADRMDADEPRMLSQCKTIGWQPTCACDVHLAQPATVLDPFFGAGTTGMVADQLGRNCIGIELNASYAAMAERRVRDDAGMFAEVAAE